MKLRTGSTMLLSCSTSFNQLQTKSINDWFHLKLVHPFQEDLFSKLNASYSGIKLKETSVKCEVETLPLSNPNVKGKTYRAKEWSF